ncbi:MAG: hypothetical protein WBN48_11650 [Thiogranum sp.]|jgi:hypothetical protein
MHNVFHGKPDGSEAVRKHYYPLAGFCLRTALRSAENSFAKEDPNDILREVIKKGITTASVGRKNRAAEAGRYVA